MLAHVAIKKIKENKTADIWLHAESYDKVDHRTAMDVADAMRDNTAVTELSFQNNDIGAVFNVHREDYVTVTEGIKALCDALQSSTTLKELGLGATRLQPEHAEDIASLIANNQSITHLYLHNNSLGNYGIATICKALKQNHTLTVLYINENKIKETAEQGASKPMRALGSALKTNQTLQKLGLSFNHIGAEGAKFLGEGLKANSSLRELHLRNTDLDNQGVVEIINAINHTQALQILDLTANSFTVNGAQTLANALGKNRSLTELDLRQNELLGDEGIRCITKTLGQHPTLTTLKLECSKEALPEVFKNLSHCATLTTLDVRDNITKHLSHLFAGHKNIVYVYYASAHNGEPFCDVSDIYVNNQEKAKELINTLQEAPEELTREQLREIQERLPAIIAVAKRGYQFSSENIKELLNIACAKAKVEHMDFTLPAHMADIKGETPIPVVAASPYRPVEEPVDMAAIDSLEDIRKPVEARRHEYPSVLSQVVRQGKFEELLAQLTEKGQRLTAQDYQLRDSHRDPSVIEMLAQQGKLAQVFSLEHWKANSEEFRAVAALVTPETFEQQVGYCVDTMAEMIGAFANAEKGRRFKRPSNLSRVM